MLWSDRTPPPGTNCPRQYRIIRRDRTLLALLAASLRFVVRSRFAAQSHTSPQTNISIFRIEGSQSFLDTSLKKKNF